MNHILKADTMRVWERTCSRLSKYPLFNNAPNMENLMPVAAPYFLDWLLIRLRRLLEALVDRRDYANIQVPALTIAACMTFSRADRSRTTWVC